VLLRNGSHSKVLLADTAAHNVRAAVVHLGLAEVVNVHPQEFADSFVQFDQDVNTGLPHALIVIVVRLQVARRTCTTKPPYLRQGGNFFT